MTKKMNYINLVNDFWKLNNTESFNTTEIALYFYLLHVNNSCYWKSTFNHNNKKIEASLDISYKTLRSARQRLANANLLEFETKNGIPNVTYRLDTSSKIPEVWDEVSPEVKAKVSAEGRAEINKTTQNKTKSNLLLKKEAKEEECLNIERFTKKEFRKELLAHGANAQHVEDWLKVREKKRAAPTKTALNNFLIECKKHNFPIANAVKIAAEQSWSGFKVSWLKNLKTTDKPGPSMARVPRGKYG